MNPSTDIIDSTYNNHVGGDNLPRELFRPQIGYFNIGARDGDMWCLPVSLMDDEQPEPLRLLQVELFVSDNNVMPVRRVVNLTIIDDDNEPTSELLCLLVYSGGCELGKEFDHLRLCHRPYYSYSL